jgi:hypothetical protein
VLRGGHHRLPVAAFLQLAVADQDVRPSPGHVQLGGQGVPDGDRQTVAQGPGVGLDTADPLAVRMAVERREGFEERGEVLDGQESEGGEGGVEDAGDVALGQDEAVPFRVVDGVRADVEHRPVQGGQDVDGGEVAADMSGIRVVHELEILDADLPGGLGDVRDLIGSAGVRVQPAEDGHGDVFDGQRGHAVSSLCMPFWPSPARPSVGAAGCRSVQAVMLCPPSS